MLNPFVKFEQRFADAFKKAKKRYLVSQTFNRDNDMFSEQGKDKLIMTHYEDLGLAQIHLNAVSHDKYAAILDLEKPEHYSKLSDMIGAESKYKVYSSLIIDPKVIRNALDNQLRYNMMRYIENNTNWSIGRDQTVKPDMQLIFGELFVIIKYGSQTLRVKLEDIEKA